MPNKNLSRKRTALATLVTTLSFGLGFGLGCASDKAFDKGDIDTSSPPETPRNGPSLGKADSGDQIVDLDASSEHPYGNHVQTAHRINLAESVPFCAVQARLHFAALRTESRYDYVIVIDSRRRVVNVYTGNHDNTWTDWIDIQADKNVHVVLDTDGSITSHGFDIDAVEYRTESACPPIAPCPNHQIDAGGLEVNECGCGGPRECVALEDIEIEHIVAGGFSGQGRGKIIRDGKAYKYLYIPGHAAEYTPIGTVDDSALARTVRRIVGLGLLAKQGTVDPGNMSETFRIQVGSKRFVEIQRAGAHTADVASAIAWTNELFECGAENKPLSCSFGSSCQSGACLACVCNQVYQPVCGMDGAEYTNQCAANCAGTTVKHAGLCGIEGDMCGSFRGLSCQPTFKCRYGASQFSAPFPDASGSCVSETYCDQVEDCHGLFHIAVPGRWQCNTNSCDFVQGMPWSPMDVQIRSAHPYGNHEARWFRVVAPVGATAVQLTTNGTFDIERGTNRNGSPRALDQAYDQLTVWSYTDGEWKAVRTYSGRQGPNGDIFPGRFHYVHFASDISVTRHGFDISASYRVR